jgi:hypothetical protein
MIHFLFDIFPASLFITRYGPGIITLGFLCFLCICYDVNSSPMNRPALSKVEVFISAGSLKMGKIL